MLRRDVNNFSRSSHKSLDGFIDREMRPWNPVPLKALAQLIIQRYQLLERHLSFDVVRIRNIEKSVNLLPPRFANIVRNFWIQRLSAVFFGPELFYR